MFSTAFPVLRTRAVNSAQFKSTLSYIRTPRPTPISSLLSSHSIVVRSHSLLARMDANGDSDNRATAAKAVATALVAFLQTANSEQGANATVDATALQDVAGHLRGATQAALSPSTQAIPTSVQSPSTAASSNQTIGSIAQPLLGAFPINLFVAVLRQISYRFKRRPLLLKPSHPRSHPRPPQVVPTSRR